MFGVHLSEGNLLGHIGIQVGKIAMLNRLIKVNHLLLSPTLVNEKSLAELFDR